MKCDELNAYVAGFDGILHKNQRHGDVYLKDDVDAAIAELKQKLSEKDKEITELKDKRLDVKDFAHVLKAFKFYLCQLTHCAYDERTAQWIIDNWEQDYERVEEYNGLG